MTLCDPEPEDIAQPGTRELDLPEGVPPLTSFYLYLTNSCNLRCHHCWITPSFVKGEPAPGDYLDLALLKKAVAEAKPLGLYSAKLTGGEPMLHPQFIEIADLLTSEGLSLSLETNGTLIDAKLAHHLKEHINLKFVSVSIDGSAPEIHDPFRGVEGSFEAAVSGFRHLVEAGFRPQLIMCPHRGNIKDIEGVVELAVELGAGSVKFNPVMRAGRGVAMHEHGEALDPEEVLELAHFVRGPLQRRTPIRLIADTPLALYTVSELVHRGTDGMCHVRNILGILGSGEMALCGIGRNIPELCFGNLQDTTVTDAWISHPVLQKLRQDLDGEYPGICGRCIHAKRCLTWCVAFNYQNTGQLVTPAQLCTEAYNRGKFPTSRLKEQHDGR
jgi:SynChlorMet cassette radical SAM/SPASM protein ScmF